MKKRLVLILAALVFILAVPGFVNKDDVYAASSKKTGFYQEDGKWVYYNNGKISKVTSVIKGKVKDETGWWYIENGTVKFKDTVAKNDLGWWRIKNGRVDFDFTGIAENSYGSWYCRDGKVDFNYTDFVQYDRAWWYVKNGQVQKNAKGVFKGTVNGESNWWNVVNGKVFFKDTIAKNQYGWWRIKNGRVDFTCNSVEKNENGWFYIKDGKVDFSYTGLAKNSMGWWYCVNGKVNFNYNGFLSGTVDGVEGTYYLKGSKVQTGATVAKYKTYWVYVNNGMIDYSYTGFAKNDNGWWYIDEGEVDFYAEGLYKGTVNGKTGYYLVDGGKVTNKTTIASNSSGKWYVKGGMVDFTYTGYYRYNGEDIYIKNGKVEVDDVQTKMYKKAQNYSSYTRYLIMVNREDSKVMILEGYSNNWDCIKYWDCNCGADGHDTPEGIYETTSLKMLYFGPDDEYRCWYATQFYGDVLFHSVKYKGGEDSPVTVIDGRLGVNTSLGCVRLQLENAKWIYDYVPAGTKVVVY